MKSTLFLLILTAAMLAVPAFAQESQNCYKPDSYTTVCEFSPSGRVNETSAFADGHYYSRWYTREEWAQHVEMSRVPSKAEEDAAARKLCKLGILSKPYCADYLAKHPEPVK